MKRSWWGAALAGYDAEQPYDDGLVCDTVELVPAPTGWSCITAAIAVPTPMQTDAVRTVQIPTPADRRVESHFRRSSYS